MNKFTLDNAGNYGEVRSVNGIKPDENGNVNAGEKVDLILNLNTNDAGYIESDDIEIVEGSFENILSTLRDRRIPVVKLRFYREKGIDYYMVGYECNAIVCYYAGDIYLGYIYPGFADHLVLSGNIVFKTTGEFKYHDVAIFTLTDN